MLARRRLLPAARTDRRRAGAWRASLLALGLVPGAVACSPPTCPAGQNQICRGQNDCRCGPICTSMADCSGRDACVRFASDPTGPGVCADVVWAYNNPPCVPLCTSAQFCVEWGDRPSSCADPCTRGADCASGCCLQLQSGDGVCAPTSRYCADRCNPPCEADQVCLLLTRPTCADTCDTDADCGAESCCLPLQGGGGACAPGGVYCPTMPPPPCRTMEACTRAFATFRPAPAESACGAHGSYDGAVANDCAEPVECRACWFSPEANAYTDCVPVGRLPSGATAPAGPPRCADAPLPEPPLRIRCVDVPSFESGNDCLGHGPL